MMVIEGNHEIEADADGRSFQAYVRRYRVPFLESGSPSPLYYSFDLAGEPSLSAVIRQYQYRRAGQSFQVYIQRCRVPFLESGSPSSLHYSFDLAGKPLLFAVIRQC
jgi:hypothetical protein